MLIDMFTESKLLFHCQMFLGSLLPCQGLSIVEISKPSFWMMMHRTRGSKYPIRIAVLMADPATEPATIISAYRLHSKLSYHRGALIKVDLPHVKESNVIQGQLEDSWATCESDSDPMLSLFREPNLE
jgi:hypothetical protein